MHNCGIQTVLVCNDFYAPYLPHYSYGYKTLIIHYTIVLKPTHMDLWINILQHGHLDGIF